MTSVLHAAVIADIGTLFGAGLSWALWGRGALPGVLGAILAWPAVFTLWLVQP